MGSGRAVPPGDAGALAEAVAELLVPSTDAAARSGRLSRQPPDQRERFAKLFRQVTESRHRGLSRAH
jgi:hypothetical protein